MEKITGTLVTGHLGNIISSSSYRRIYAAHMIVQDEFNHFTTEAIIYARLEWSKFLRDGYSEEDRLKYLWEKCFEYDSPGVRIPIVDVEIHDVYGIKLIITQHSKIVVEKEEDDLPF
jgi:hypothetical protein